jgi:hypothetical protein
MSISVSINRRGMVSTNEPELGGMGHGRNNSGICRSIQDRCIDLLRSRSPFRGARHREYRNEHCVALSE